VPDACLMRMQTCQQTRPGGATTCSIVELGEAKPTRCQPIEVWRVDLASIAPQIRIAEIVRKNQDEVGPLFWRGAENGRHEHAQQNGLHKPRTSKQEQHHGSSGCS
jgi:hypothetical protein